jgi:signal transduction histidine kinase
VGGAGAGLLGEAQPRRGRLVIGALAVAFAAVLTGLYGADRALARADAAQRQLAAYRAAVRRDPELQARLRDAVPAEHAQLLTEPLPAGQLRAALWVLGLTALGGLAVGLTHERRQQRRIVERSRELEHLSAELMRVNRAKSEFLANVSHELRTPLNAIVGFVDLLQDGVYGELPPRQAGPVQRIASSATHLRHLVDQILDLAKITAGRLEVHQETLDLRPFVFDVLTEVESLANEKGLTLSLGVASSLPRLRTDPVHLRQILVNLLGNAVKFTPQGGIAVRAALVEREENDERGERESRVVRLVGRLVRGPRSVAGDTTEYTTPHMPDGGRFWIALQVSDTGIGIPAADVDRIFDEFEQVGAGARGGERSRSGTGLGLAISRRLARLIDGDLTVESVVGRGSTFTLWLKVEEADVIEWRGRATRRNQAAVS